jgi:hypothetical protein
MMRHATIGGSAFEVDADATRAAYARIARGDAETCACSRCRNYVAVRDRALPPGVRGILEALGVDVAKEADVMDLGPASDGGTRVVVTFHAVGRPAGGEAPAASWAPETGVQVSLGAGDWHAAPEFRGQPLLLASVELSTPWVLSEPHPEAPVSPLSGR